MEVNKAYLMAQTPLSLLDAQAHRMAQRGKGPSRAASWASKQLLLSLYLAYRPALGARGGLQKPMPSRGAAEVTLSSTDDEPPAAKTKTCS